MENLSIMLMERRIDMAIPIDKRVKDALTEVIYAAVCDAVCKQLKMNVIEYKYSTTVPSVEVQYCYDSKTNKVYLEFQNNKYMQYYYSRFIPRINDKIIRYINSNYKDIAACAPTEIPVKIFIDIINMEDDTQEPVDDYLKLTPYTIGYWESLYGGWRYITDKTITYNQLQGLHQKGVTKTFQEFIDIVAEVRKHYADKILTPAEEAQYKQLYKTAYANYHDDTDRLNQEIEAINAQFGIGTPHSKKIPQEFAEFRTEYGRFFGANLPNIAPNTKRYALEFELYTGH